MKQYPRTMLACAIGISSMASSFAQSTFQNLGFEAANNIPVFNPQGHPWEMSAANAMPGWTCYLGTNQTGNAWYNDIALDSAAVGVQSSTSQWAPTGVRTGEYCVSLQPGYIFTSPFDFYFGRASIAQTGQLPSDAKSIHFRATYPFSVTFAGTPIPLVVLATRTDFNFYGGDLSQFAGQTGELRIMSSPRSSFALADVNYLDAIVFSAQPIPEPSTLSLVSLGLGLFFTLVLVQKRNSLRLFPPPNHITSLAALLFCCAGCATSCFDPSTAWATTKARPGATAWASGNYCGWTPMESRSGSCAAS